MIPPGTALQPYSMAMPHLHLALILVVIVAHICYLSSPQRFGGGRLGGEECTCDFFGLVKT